MPPSTAAGRVSGPAMKLALIWLAESVVGAYPVNLTIDDIRFISFGPP